MNSFTINCLRLANDSSCNHLLSDCVPILSGSNFTCSKQYFKPCSKHTTAVGIPKETRLIRSTMINNVIMCEVTLF